MATKKIRREAASKATRVYLIVERVNGKAVRCEMTRKAALASRDQYGKAYYRVEPAQAVPDSIEKAAAAARSD